MKYRINTHHKERSALFIAYLRDSTKRTKRALYEDVEAIYREHGMDHAAPALETVFSYLKGRKKIPFDPPNRQVYSWLMCTELRFPRSSRYFFHPMSNLLAGPLLSSEKWETSFSKWPDHWVEDSRLMGDMKNVRKQEKIRKLKRIRRKPLSYNMLEWIHINMYRLDVDVRIILIAEDEHGWGRHYQDPEIELDQLISIGGFEALTGAVAVLQEASLIRDFRRATLAIRAIKSLMPILETSPLLKNVCDRYTKEINDLCELFSTPHYYPHSLKENAYPISWRALPDEFHPNSPGVSFYS